MISPSWFSLLAAPNTLFGSENMPKIGSWSLASILPIVLTFAGFGLGILFARTIRMREYGWKVGLILACWLGSLSVVLLGDYKLGVDLQGGVILVYQVDKKETAALNPTGRSDDWDMGGLVEVLRKRLNPDGLKEIVIRPSGADQIEIVVPEADPEEIEKIKRQITTGGLLRFLIVASSNNVSDSDLIETATEQSSKAGQELDRNVMIDGKVAGYWAEVGREEEDLVSPFRLDSAAFDIIRDARTGKIIELTQQQRNQLGSGSALSNYLAGRNIQKIDVLMVVDPTNDMRGSDLYTANSGHDGAGNPNILFTTRGDGVTKMSNLTRENIDRKLGIVLDNVLLSAPNINSMIGERGEITGRFTQKEVNFMVEMLRAGSMPVVLYDNPISDNRIGSMLGKDTIRKGSLAILWSLVLVLGFTAIYYRVAGVVACLALILNLLMTVAIMVMLKAPFTLPGLAGLVLTVGMSLDANVLIFERFREEREKGAALRSAIRNGFDRAMVTVIDSNLTTLLTAVVLYAIGTDQVRGFGITLILGILTSMFTAIFMARVIFEIAERKRWIQDLTMVKMFKTLNVDWMRLFAPATIASVILIAIGLIATVARGKSLFDTDLVGGTSVSFVLQEPESEIAVRDRLGKSFEGITDDETKSRVDYSVTSVEVAGEKPNTVWKVDSSLQDIRRLQDIVAGTFDGDDKHALRTYQMEVKDVRQTDQPVVSQGPAPPIVIETPTIPGLNGKQTPETTIEAAPPGAVAPATPASPTSELPPATTDPAAKSEPAAADNATPPSDAKSNDTPPAVPAAPADQPAKSPEQPAAPKDGETNGATPDGKSASIQPTRGIYLTSYLLQDTPSTDSGKAAADAPPATNAESKAAPGADGAKTDAEAPPATTPPATNADAPPVGAEGATPAASTTPAAVAPAAATPATTGAGAVPSGDQAAAESKEWTTATLQFGDSAISGQALRDRITALATKNGVFPIVVVDNPKWDRRDNSAFREWTVSINLPEAQGAEVLKQLDTTYETTPVWLTSSKIGGQVSSDTRWAALEAILFSLVGILAYVWFRFQRLSWGIAAIAALVHDSLVMLGAIAASYWLASSLGFLGVEEFKISLPVIAAFLTLIGYSINDTIVIFDRIREIRGKNLAVTSDMINLSVNQTMSRTILTGGLTLAVVVILYAFGGPGIHAFAFSLVVGVIAGTYSTVFIASPLLVYLMGRGETPAAKQPPRPMARNSA